MSQAKSSKNVMDRIVAAGARGYVVRESDVGDDLGDHFGRARHIDVGRRVWMRAQGLVMESVEQATERAAAYSDKK